MTVHVSIPLDETLKARLDEMAAACEASPEALAAQAIERMIEDDAAFNAAMDEAEADVAAGRTYANDEVFAEVRAIIAARK
jgi:predicted transcriptional regulator